LQSSDSESGDGQGRIVEFPNSVVFDHSAGIFKQLPGTRFLWHEVSLTVPPDTDFREKQTRLLAAVESVFEEYRPAIEQQHRDMDRLLGITTPIPRPHTRLRVASRGVEIRVRYPVEIENAAEIDDRVAAAGAGWGFTTSASRISQFSGEILILDNKDVDAAPGELAQEFGPAHLRKLRRALHRDHPLLIPVNRCGNADLPGRFVRSLSQRGEQTLGNGDMQLGHARPICLLRTGIASTLACARASESCAVIKRRPSRIRGFARAHSS